MSPTGRRSTKKRLMKAPYDRQENLLAAAGMAARGLVAQVHGLRRSDNASRVVLNRRP